MATDRIDWSPDGTQLLTCIAGTLRVHGQATTILDGELLDARWRGDAIVAIGRDGVRRWYRDGEVETVGEPLRRIAYASIAAIADEAVVMTGPTVSVETLDGNTRWRFRQPDGFEVRTSATLSPDGKLVAIGYETVAEANFNYRRDEGRGWIVMDTIKNTIVDRQWAPMKRTLARAGLAFCGKTKRLAIATPETGPSIGVIRVGRDEAYPRTHPGGARAVAIDDRGVLVAYAYPRGIGERRLRVDYLESTAKGGSQIEITDTLWIDPALDGEIVAIAFDRKSRRIACVDAAGQLDRVPVP